VHERSTGRRRPERPRQARTEQTETAAELCSSDGKIETTKPIEWERTLPVLLACEREEKINRCERKIGYREKLSAGRESWRTEESQREGGVLGGKIDSLMPRLKLDART
jgi:hypothetical protein